jgi:hypothetical protein
MTAKIVETTMSEEEATSNRAADSAEATNARWYYGTDIEASTVKVVRLADIDPAEWERICKMAQEAAEAGVSDELISH